MPPSAAVEGGDGGEEDEAAEEAAAAGATLPRGRLQRERNKESEVLDRCSGEAVLRVMGPSCMQRNPARRVREVVTVRPTKASTVVDRGYAQQDRARSTRREAVDLLLLIA